MRQVSNIKSVISLTSITVVALSFLFLFGFKVDALSKTSSCNVDNYNELTKELISVNDHLCAIKGFDPTSGELQTVTVLLKTEVTAKATIENLNPGNALVQVNWSLEIGSNFNQPKHLTTQSPFGVLDSIPSYDGTLDFAGDSAKSFSEVVIVDQNIQIIDSQNDLELFSQKSVSEPTINIPINFSAQQYQPQINIAAKLEMKSRAHIDVNFTYKILDIAAAIDALKNSTRGNILNFSLAIINARGRVYEFSLNTALNTNKPFELTHVFSLFPYQ